MSVLMTNYDHLTKRMINNQFKVLVVGDPAVGKTSLISVSTSNEFQDAYSATVGMDFITKHVYLNKIHVRLQLWDVAGQDRLGPMTRFYYKDAVGCIIVFDVTRKETFDNVLNWKRNVNENVMLLDGTDLPCLLIGNKCDEPCAIDIVHNDEQLAKFCKDNNFFDFEKTSAKNKIGIEDAMKRLSIFIAGNKDIYPYSRPENVIFDNDYINLVTEVNKVDEPEEGIKCSGCLVARSVRLHPL